MQRNWWLLVHIAAVLGFMMAHGASAAVLYRLRRERDRERIRTLLQFSGSTARTMYISLVIIIAAGIRLAFLTSFYKSQTWPWLSLGLLVGTAGLMFFAIRPYYRRVAELTLLRPSGAPRASDEELESVLRSPRPMIIAHLGFAVLLAILYMMIFKKPA
jgi:uncharacterized membrane protein